MNGGAWAAAGKAADDDGAGVDDLLPKELVPILYDWDMFVRPKNDDAAANIVKFL